uniref:Uncharacterized protein n=1 Tax=Lepeophtheirus salmonis TaxID=72036 RepID=A0A0K2V731_LEPSM
MIKRPHTHIDLYY